MFGMDSIIRGLRAGRVDFDLIDTGLLYPTKDQLSRIIDELVEHPDVVKHVVIDYRLLDRAARLKLAQYVSSSLVIETLDLCYGPIDEELQCALAAALRVNSSLRYLNIAHDNVDVPHNVNVDSAFIYALRCNPRRPDRSRWMLYHPREDTLPYLKGVADRMGHPTLMELLSDRYLLEKRKVQRRIK